LDSIAHRDGAGRDVSRQRRDVNRMSALHESVVAGPEEAPTVFAPDVVGNRGRRKVRLITPRDQPERVLQQLMLLRFRSVCRGYGLDHWYPGLVRLQPPDLRVSTTRRISPRPSAKAVDFAIARSAPGEVALAPRVHVPLIPDFATSGALARLVDALVGRWSPLSKWDGVAHCSYAASLRYTSRESQVTSGRDG
jgi:hypothetical protein